MHNSKKLLAFTVIVACAVIFIVAFYKPFAVNNDINSNSYEHFNRVKLDTQPVMENGKRVFYSELINVIKDSEEDNNGETTSDSLITPSNGENYKTTVVNKAFINASYNGKEWFYPFGKDEPATSFVGQYPGFAVFRSEKGNTVSFSPDLTWAPDSVSFDLGLADDATIDLYEVPIPSDGRNYKVQMRKLLRIQEVKTEYYQHNQLKQTVYNVETAVVAYQFRIQEQ